MASAGEVVGEWKRRLRAGEWAQMGEIVDLDGYTEICLGLTGWTTGYDVATQNYMKNRGRTRSWKSGTSSRGRKPL